MKTEGAAQPGLAEGKQWRKEEIRRLCFCPRLENPSKS